MSLPDENRTYIVTGSYQTESGNMGTFRFEMPSTDCETAMYITEQRIKSDKRRRYMGKLDMSCSVLWP